MTRSPLYEDGCTLVPVNHNNQADWDELRQQRKACGWHYSPPYMNEWITQGEQGLKTIFWITIKARDGRTIRAGHISLDSLDNSPDPDFQNSDRSLMTIKTFFIMQEYRSLGLGRKGMDLVEAQASKSPYGSPNCRGIVVDTLSVRNFETEEGTARMWKCYPGAMKDGQRGQNEEWYVRRGYAKLKEVPSYGVKDDDGKMNYFLASYLKKDLT